MDARLLGPAIVALADVCERANECVNEGRVQASVRIKGNFKTGSFEVIYELVQTLSDHARRLVGLDPAIIGPKEILSFIGLAGTVASTGAVSALRLIRAWHETEPDIDLEASSDGKVSVKLKGKLYRVRREIVKLAQYPPLRTALGGLTRPLTEQSIDALEIRDTSSRKTARVIDTITKDDAMALSAPVPDIAPVSAIETYSGKRVAVLQIVRAGLVGDVSWTFREGDEAGLVSLAITDAEFLSERDRGEIAFRSGDFLHVEIEWQTTIGGQRHQLKQKIVRVLKYIRRPLQTALLPPGRPSDA